MSETRVTGGLVPVVAAIALVLLMVGIFLFALIGVPVHVSFGSLP